MCTNASAPSSLNVSSLQHSHLHPQHLISKFHPIPFHSFGKPVPTVLPAAVLPISATVGDVHVNRTSFYLS